MSGETPKKRSSRLFLALTLLLAAGLLYLAVRNVDWNELVFTLSRVNPLWLALGVLILSLSCLVRGFRWRVLLSAEKTLPLPTVFWGTMTGYLGNAYLPARAGEVIRSVLIGQKGGISKSFSLATALTERIVDAVLLVAVSAVALTTITSLAPELLQGLRVMAVIGALGALALFAAPHMRGLLQNIITRLPFSEKLRDRLGGVTGNFLTGAGALQDWTRLINFLLASAGIWSLDTLTGLAVASAFGVSLSLTQVFILLAALGISSALPSTPGALGIYQYVAVAVLVPFGLSEAQSLAYILGYQGVMYAVITTWGLIGLWKLRGAIRFAGLEGE